MNIMITMVFTAAIASFPVEPASIIPEDIKVYARKLVATGYTPGLAIGVIAGDRQEFFFAGQRAHADATPVDERTVFEIGSITKVFTALLLADAVDRGAVRLDDPVQQFLPDAIQVPKYGGKVITLLELARHRSALPRNPSNLTSDKHGPFATYTPGKLYDFLAHFQLQREIGEKYEYSNLGFGLLGHALAHQSKTDYETLLVDRVCNPLGLSDTRTSLTSDMLRRSAPGHADDMDQPVENWTFDCMAGCGAVHSTARDMLRFVAANMGLTKSTLRSAMERSHRGRHDTSVESMSVALGWHVLNRHGVEIIWHNGGTGGYHSFCGFAPKQGLGIVVLANSTHDIDDLGRHYLAPEYNLAEIREIQVAVKIPSDELEDYLGYYRIPPGIMIHLSQKQGRLFVQLSGQTAIRIFRRTKEEFFCKVVDAQISFVRNKTGIITSLILHQSGANQEAEKMPQGFEPIERQEVEVSPKILATYVGRYQLLPSIVVDVHLVDGALMTQVNGQPAYPIFAESKRNFFYKVVDAQITFVVDGPGCVQSLVLHQMGVDQTAMRLN